MLIGGGATIGGFVVGFIFGIPKTPEPVSPETTAERPAAAQRPQLVNTNLEQVSDWLTKIIVGLSLVEFKPIIGKISQLATYLGNGMGWSVGGPEYATAIIAYFSPLGFFFGWVITRTYIAEWLEEEA